MEIIDPEKYNKKLIPRKGESEEDPGFASRFADYAKKATDKLVDAMNQEADETREMGIAFFRLLEHKLQLNERSEPPTKEEVKRAIQQLKDVGRISVFASISILPGGGVSLVGLELLARKFGIDHFTLVPSSFRKNKR